MLLYFIILSSISRCLKSLKMSAPPPYTPVDGQQGYQVTQPVISNAPTPGYVPSKFFFSFYFKKNNNKLLWLFQDSSEAQMIINWHCVVPENIHTPTTEGISLRTPPPSLDFPFFEVSYKPPIPPDFPQFVKQPPNPSGKFRSRRESVKNEATDPNLNEAKPFRLS